MLTPEDQRTLLALAHEAIRATVMRQPPVPVTTGLDLPDAAGLFVTIRHEDVLRGCLGTLRITTGLAAEVVRCAADSASADRRFPPVRPEELPGVSVEISVLGPLERVDHASPAGFTVGVHGLVVERGARRGLLLPQVAAERGWTAEEFLCQTAIKAGLAADAWRHADASVFRFTADVFGD